jgi:hypothetical protein
MTTPFELIVGPVELYTGPVNETRTDLEDAPAGNWVLLGTNGDQNYGEDGVAFEPEQTIEEWFSLGSTAPQQAFRTQERLTVTLTLFDLTAEHLAKVWNDVTVTDTAPGSGTAGVRDFNMLRGATVSEYGLLLRWPVSPYITDAKMQVWIPRAYVESMGALTSEKGVPVGTEIVFSALEHATNGFGKYEVQDEQGT